MKLGRAATIGRWKPLHNGGAVMLEALCESADHVVIGIGSCNKYNARNPFTAEESKEMIDAFLKSRFDNYEFLFIPDFAHLPEYQDGQKWRQYMIDKLGELDCFVTANEYVKNLFGSDYKIVYSPDLVPKEKQVIMRATAVRVEMAKKGDWQAMVPQPVAEYIMRNKLDERFRKEFGLETIAMMGDKEYWMPETREQEKSHTLEA